jgi:hypothetical protein
MLPHFSSVGSSVFHRYSVSSSVVLGSALTEVALLPATGRRSALQANSCCVKSFAPASLSLAHPHEVPPLKRPHAANSYIVRYFYLQIRVLPYISEGLGLQVISLLKSVIEHYHVHVQGRDASAFIC